MLCTLDDYAIQNHADTIRNAAFAPTRSVTQSKLYVYLCHVLTCEPAQQLESNTVQDCYVLVDFDELCRCMDHPPRHGQVQGQSQLARTHPLAGAGVQALLDLRVCPKLGLQQRMNTGQVLRHLRKKKVKLTNSEIGASISLCKGSGHVNRHAHLPATSMCLCAASSRNMQ